MEVVREVESHEVRNQSRQHHSSRAQHPVYQSQVLHEVLGLLSFLLARNLPQKFADIVITKKDQQKAVNETQSCIVGHGTQRILI